MAAKIRQREIGGQLLYDEPFHCSWCGFYYRGRGRKRVKLDDWFEVRDPRSRQITLEPVTIRICTANPENPHGCIVFGFEKLLRIHRRSAIRAAHRLESAA